MVRVLIIGAGGIGGYFGGRLTEAGADVTFLVRERRKQELMERGLVIQSVHGDYTCRPKVLVNGEDAAPFDYVLLAVKSYHLESAIKDMASYVSDRTAVIPLLNGVTHLGELQKAFGTERVLGGLCFIETTLTNDGVIRQTSKFHDIVFGELDGKPTERAQRFADLCSGAYMSANHSIMIKKDMWEKYLFITLFSGITTMMRAAIGIIKETDSGMRVIEGLLDEILLIFQEHHAPLEDGARERQIEKIKALGYEMKSSMLRDMEKGYRTEADHLQGYLLELAEQYNLETPLLHASYAHLKIYEKSLAE